MLLQFYINKATEWACLKRIGTHALGPEHPASMGFVLRIPPGSGCEGVLAVFGMNGPASLLFAHLVATRLPQLLDGPGLSMVEIHTEPIPANPPSLTFAQKLRYEVLLDRQALPETAADHVSREKPQGNTLAGALQAPGIVTRGLSSMYPAPMLSRSQRTECALPITPVRLLRHRLPWSSEEEEERHAASQAPPS